MNRIYIILALFGVIVTSSCSTRNEKESTLALINVVQEDFKASLISAKNGWHIEYFPKLDTLLNSDIHQNILLSSSSLEPSSLMKNSGVGGYNIFVKFNANNSAEFLSDIAYYYNTEDSYIKPVFNQNIDSVKYKVSTSDGLCLYFTTSNMLEQLVNFNVNVSTKFNPIYVKMDTAEINPKDTIIFRSYNYITGGNEIIRMTSMQTPIDMWKDKMSSIMANKLAYLYRQYSDNTHSTDRASSIILKIIEKKTSNVIYQTTSSLGKLLMDYRISPKSYDNSSLRRLARYDRLQYSLFIKNENPNAGISSKIYSAIGSGWIATDKGIRFEPGLRYNSKLIFKNFIKVPGKVEWRCTDNPEHIAVLTF